MSIASEIIRIKNGVTNAYQACIEKDATLPTLLNSNNLTSCIKSINANNSNIDNIGIPKEITSDGVLVLYSNPLNFSLPNEATSIGSYGLYSAFSDCTSLTSVSLPNVNSIGDYGLHSAFRGCTSLTTVNFPNVISMGSFALDSAFRGCTSLTTVSFPNVTSIGYYALSSAFTNCTSLTTISLPSLNSNSFGTYNYQFRYMLAGVTGCTVHFPSNLESVIGSWSDVTSGFGGTNTTVLFDLPATS